MLKDHSVNLSLEVRLGSMPCPRLEREETLRTILSLLDSNASRDNIRRVVEAAISDNAK